MRQKRKTRVADVDVIESIADLSGAVEWTNDELRDSLREDGVDPDSLVKNVLSGIKRMNADLEKQTDIENDPDPMHQLATEFFEDFSKGVGPLGPRLKEPSKRAERSRDYGSHAQSPTKSSRQGIGGFAVRTPGYPQEVGDMANPEFRPRGMRYAHFRSRKLEAEGVPRLLELLVLKYLCKKRLVKSVRQ